MSCCGFLKSSVGRKIIVALSGIVLLLFVLGHMVGNLTVFMGADVINSYAQFLHNSLHGMGVWLARIALLGAVAAHIVFSIILTRENRAARGSEKYAVAANRASTSASRWMIMSGLLILAFIIYHLWHFTISPAPGDANYLDATYLAETGGERRDVFTMVVVGFQNPFVSIFYLIAIALLCWHISHGFASVFQTLGIRNKENYGLIQKLSWAFSGVILLGNFAIVMAIWFGFVK